MFRKSSFNGRLPLQPLNGGAWLEPGPVSLTSELLIDGYSFREQIFTSGSCVTLSELCYFSGPYSPCRKVKPMPVDPPRTLKGLCTHSGQSGFVGRGWKRAGLGFWSFLGLSFPPVVFARRHPSLPRRWGWGLLRAEARGDRNLAPLRGLPTPPRPHLPSPGAPGTLGSAPPHPAPHTNRVHVA